MSDKLESWDMPEEKRQECLNACAAKPGMSHEQVATCLLMTLFFNGYSADNVVEILCTLADPEFLERVIAVAGLEMNRRKAEQ